MPPTIALEEMFLQHAAGCYSASCYLSIIKSVAVECRVPVGLGILSNLNEFLEFDTNYEGRFLNKQEIFTR